MKQIITEKDLDNLIGKFVVQLDEYQDEPCMVSKFRSNSGFWLEKRISFLGVIHKGDVHIKKGELEISESKIILNGFYYCRGVYSKKDFVEYFNNYLKGNEGKRYHRLLTHKELDWLNEELKKQ